MKLLRGILIALAHFLISVFAGALGWEPQMVIVSVASILALFAANRLVSPKIWVGILVIAPFYLLYSIGSALIGEPATYPIWSYGIFVSLVTLLLFKFNKPPLFSISLLSLLVLAGSLLVWPNWFAFTNTQRDPLQYQISRAKLVNSQEQEVAVNQFSGKVIVFDIWHSACYNCIQQFPHIQKLSDRFGTDTSVRIISLNFPIEWDKGLRPARLTAPYSFEKMYFKDEDEFRKFSELQSEPLTTPIVLIMDKNFQCRYAGALNVEPYVFIGNAYRIINQLRKE